MFEKLNELLKKKEEKEEEVKFVISLDASHGVVNFPESLDKTKIDFRYPLIVPYAYAHITWDDVQGELVYKLEEPILDPKEREILVMLEQGVREFINMGFIGVKEKEALIEFLEKNVKILLLEMNIHLDKNSYLKLMYYVYRDFIGLNRIEPLMNDMYIEDIECNGKNSPIYIVHRRYGNIRTSIIYETLDELSNFVEKLAQKCGRFISYSSPIVDGVLPSGDRVNATYTEDVSSKGPTFSIRMFTKEPWSPIKLMKVGTISPEILAYLWILIENGSNILVVGGTGSGKCVTGDTLVYLPNGDVKEIKKIVEEKFSRGKICKRDDWEFVENNDNFNILSMDKDSLKIIKSRVDKFWRHKSPEKLYKVLTRSGRCVKVTPEHPFFSFDDGSLIKINAEKLKISDRVAVPRNLTFDVKKKQYSPLNCLLDEKDIYVFNEFGLVNEAISKIKEKHKINDVGLSKLLNVNEFAFRSWKKENAIPLNIFNILLYEAGMELNKNMKLKSRAGSTIVKLPGVDKDIFRFVALVLADGHLAKNNVEFCNSDEKLLEEFIYLAGKLFGVNAKIEYPKNRTTKIRISSVIIARFLNKFLDVPYGKKDSKIIVPKILFEQDNESIMEFISGIFDCESYIGKSGLELGMNSKELIDSISTLLLRFGVISRIRKHSRSCRLMIYGVNNIKRFSENIFLKKQDKIDKLDILKNRTFKSIWSNVDLIPGCREQLKLFRKNLGFSQLQLASEIGVCRRLVGRWEDGSRTPSFSNFEGLANFAETENYPMFKTLYESDIFWDEILDIEVIENHNEKYVYDLTVENNHNFLAGNIPIVVHNTSFINSVAFFIPPQARIVSIEDSRELRLEHENWLPSVARAGVGAGDEKVGEVTMFDLLKSSFRQRPDYIVVGEIRGAEANVLFQAMAAGHSSMATMHADDVKTVIRRLETPPINLSPNLVETLDVICLMTFAKVKGANSRKLSAVQEILSVKENGDAAVNVPFKWDPRTDTFLFKKQSNVFDKIVLKKGISLENLWREFEIRRRLITELYKRNIIDFSEVQKIVHAYYKTPDIVLKQFGLVK